MKTMDDLIRVNTQAIKRLKQIELVEATKQPQSAISLKALNLFAGSDSAPREVMLRQYVWLLNESKDSVSRLGAQIELVMNILNEIEVSLHNLQGLYRRDENTTDKELREVHRRFWAMFGFYKTEIGDLQEKAMKIQEVIRNRNKAFSIYSGVNLNLRSMSDELVHLQDKLSLPPVSFDPDFVAAEAHAEELLKTVDRLSKQKATLAARRSEERKAYQKQTRS